MHASHCMERLGTNPNDAAEHGVEALMTAVESGDESAYQEVSGKLSQAIASTPGLAGTPAGARLAGAQFAAQGNLTAAAATTSLPIMATPNIGGTTSPPSDPSSSQMAPVLVGGDAGSASRIASTSQMSQAITFGGSDTPINDRLTAMQTILDDHRGKRS